MTQAAWRLATSAPAAAAVFTLAFVAATAPVWRIWAFGFTPALDQALQLAICGGPLR